MVETLSKSLPTYRLVFPTNQLGILNLFFPELRIMRATGSGLTSGKPQSEKLKLGVIWTRTTREARFKTNAESGRPTINDCYREFAERQVANIALDSLEYEESVTTKGHEVKYVALVFEKKTILKEKFEEMVLNGSYPQMEIYNILHEAKRKLTDEDVDEEVLKRWRPSCLMLVNIRPERRLMQDGDFVFALRRPPMFLIRDVAKHWELYDYESKPRGGPS